MVAVLSAAGEVGDVRVGRSPDRARSRRWEQARLPQRSAKTAPTIGRSLAALRLAGQATAGGLSVIGSPVEVITAPVVILCKSQQLVPGNRQPGLACPLPEFDPPAGGNRRRWADEAAARVIPIARVHLAYAPYARRSLQRKVYNVVRRTSLIAKTHSKYEVGHRKSWSSCGEKGPRSQKDRPRLPTRARRCVVASDAVRGISPSGAGREIILASADLSPALLCSPRTGWGRWFLVAGSRRSVN